MKERQGYLDHKHRQLSIRQQSNLLGLCPSSVYYKESPEYQENLEIMRILDVHYVHYVHHAHCGILTMQDHLYLFHGKVVNY